MGIKLDLSEGLVYGTQYWIVQPDIFDAVPPQRWYRQDWEDMVKWCVETYGPTPKSGVWTPGARWYVNNARFWFRDSADREWFVLKWT